ncbi:MAG: hypothetical protein PHY16_17205 [Methylobacter sp.]|nr:hypothetical protein [Methylobacter sp.]
MLTTYFKRKTTLTSYYASPAGSYLDEFTDWLTWCGFHEEVICQYLPGIVQFGIWGKKTYGNLTSLPVDALSHFRDSLAKNGRLYYSKGQHSIHWRGVQHFVEFLRLQHKIACAQTLPQAPQPELLQLFESWMHTHRGVMLSTLSNYQQHIAALLSTLGECPEKYNAKELHAFILASAKDRRHLLRNGRRRFACFFGF